MKANEAPKSKFVYPDKLYARTNDNITLDISYAPQTLEAIEYTRTNAFIEKAVEWLAENASCYVGLADDEHPAIGDTKAFYGIKSLLYDFKRDMR